MQSLHEFIFIEDLFERYSYANHSLYTYEMIFPTYSDKVNRDPDFTHFITILGKIRSVISTFQLKNIFSTFLYCF